MTTNSIAMIGFNFGALVVLNESSNSTPKNKKFIVKCIRCGKEKEMLGGNIRRAKSSFNGGCFCNGSNPSNSGRFVSGSIVSHGMSNHPAFGVWSGMISRCYSKKHVNYHRYGGRGIAVCEKWRVTPNEFLKWLDLKKWNKSLEIDRINNDDGYSPENCRLVSRKENQNNKANNRFLVINGEKITIANAARKYGINKTTIKERLNRGWSDEKSISKIKK